MDKTSFPRFKRKPTHHLLFRWVLPTTAEPHPLVPPQMKFITFFSLFVIFTTHHPPSTTQTSQQNCYKILLSLRLWANAEVFDEVWLRLGHAALNLGHPADSIVIRERSLIKFAVRWGLCECSPCPPLRSVWSASAVTLFFFFFFSTINYYLLWFLKCLILDVIILTWVACFYHFPAIGFRETEFWSWIWVVEGGLWVGKMKERERKAIKFRIYLWRSSGGGTGGWGSAEESGVGNGVVFSFWMSKMVFFSMDILREWVKI